MAWLNLELHDSSGNPLSGRRYALEFGTQTLEGPLDPQGRLSVEIPDGVSRASLILAYRRFDLDLGPLPAADSVKGVQERLNQLNFFVGKVDGDLGSFTERGLRRFQESTDLESTGRIDADTLARLAREHGT